MAINDFDDILPYVGSFGPFQKRILLLSLPVNYFLAVVYMAQLYQTLVSRKFIYFWFRIILLLYLTFDHSQFIIISDARTLVRRSGTERLGPF